MKGACSPFFLEHYHGMIGKDQTAYFRETQSGKIIRARFDPMKAKNRIPTPAFKVKVKVNVNVKVNVLKQPQICNPTLYSNPTKYTCFC